MPLPHVTLQTDQLDQGVKPPFTEGVSASINPGPPARTGQTWATMCIAGLQVYTVSRTVQSRPSIMEAFPRSRLATSSARFAALRPVAPLSPRRLQDWDALRWSIGADCTHSQSQYSCKSYMGRFEAISTELVHAACSVAAYL